MVSPPSAGEFKADPSYTRSGEPDKLMNGVIRGIGIICAIPVVLAMTVIMGGFIDDIEIDSLTRGSTSGLGARSFKLIKIFMYCGDTAKLNI
eukprot:g53155.t1